MSITLERIMDNLPFQKCTFLRIFEHDYSFISTIDETGDNWITVTEKWPDIGEFRIVERVNRKINREITVQAMQVVFVLEVWGYGSLIHREWTHGSEYSRFYLDTLKKLNSNQGDE